MYSSARVGVNVPKQRSARFVLVVMTLGLTIALFGQNGSSAQKPARTLACDPALADLFTPLRPQFGRYEVCTTPEALTAVARPGWSIESLAPLDAFGAAGGYDRAALARLYGGQRAALARGWTEEGNRFESITLISPYPDRTFTRLVPGTLVIRHVIIR
jgi:hypothetical protein